MALADIMIDLTPYIKEWLDNNDDTEWDVTNDCDTDKEVPLADGTNMIVKPNKTKIVRFRRDQKLHSLDCACSLCR